ncbi:histidine kinase [Actinocorallia longicatena]|uniref:histidine kinase n=1 Tax=Actinocorallia longicatena TaxID=111803 RepID=A0ABP6QAS6_9ACTN
MLAIAVYLTTLAGAVFHDEEAAGPPAAQVVVFGAAVCAALAYRRRWPLEVLVVVTTGTAFYLASGGLKSPLMLATMIAIYTFAVRRSRREGWTTACVISGVLLGTAMLFGARTWYGPESIALVAQAALAVCAGDAVRNHRAYIREVEARADRAERTREEEASRRVIDERLRIARELHDVLAHHIALINVQAGVASHVLEADPAQARQSLAHIRDAARSALEEVRTTIGLLRQPNSPVELEVEPSPGLDRLSDLIAGHAAAGLIVDRETEGTVRDLPPTVDLTAYRIIQEALTNVRKHGSKPYALLRLGYRLDGLAIEVVNAADPSEGEGHGLLGMRERALAVHGTFAAGWSGGDFTVTARLPYPEAPRTVRCGGGQ